MPNDEAQPATEAELESTATSPSAALSARTIVFALASIALAIAGVALALQYFVAERLPELTESKLKSAMDRWQKSGPASYDLDVELRGAQPGQVHVEVRQREVENETRDGRTPGRWTWDTWSVPGLFDTLSQDLQTAEDPEGQAAQGTKWRLRCEFDSQFGYPKQYHRLVTGGPEVFWQVTNFESK
jgi:hypothetical protein